VPVYYATFKIGASDIFNKRYIQYAGGPTIGGMYYASVTLDERKRKQIKRQASRAAAFDGYEELFRFNLVLKRPARKGTAFFYSVWIRFILPGLFR
jgi:hypothetical protein